MQLDKIQVVYGDMGCIDRGGRINTASMQLVEVVVLLGFTRMETLNYCFPFTIPPILK